MEILEQNEYKVTGLDLSGDMLKIAEQRVTGDLYRQDMREVNLPERFDAVICLGSSFTYMQTEEDVEKALTSFYNHLNPGGVLVFDSFNKEKFQPSRQGKWEEETQSFDGIEIKRRTMSSDWNPEEGTWTVDWMWSITDKSGTRHVHDRQRLKSYTIEYLREKLHETGFTDVKQIKSWRLLVEATKP